VIVANTLHSNKDSLRDYTLTFELSVVDQVEKGELIYKEAQERYGVQVSSPGICVPLLEVANNKKRRIYWFLKNKYFNFHVSLYLIDRAYSQFAPSNQG
jgi:hypothetical protein